MGQEGIVVRMAVATDDGRAIGRHFGRARMYAVLTVQDGAVTSRQLRDKSAPHWLATREMPIQRPICAAGTSSRSMAAAIGPPMQKKDWSAPAEVPSDPPPALVSSTRMAAGAVTIRSSGSTALGVPHFALPPP
jgi:hypothetical protein